VATVEASPRGYPGETVLAVRAGRAFTGRFGFGQIADLTLAGVVADRAGVSSAFGLAGGIMP
jgi:hypothetical protein